MPFHGYAHVGKIDQDLRVQQAALKAAGYEVARAADVMEIGAVARTAIPRRTPAAAEGRQSRLGPVLNRLEALGEA